MLHNLKNFVKRPVLDIDQSKYKLFYEDLAIIFNKLGYYAEYIDLPKLVPATNSGYNYGVLVIVNI